MVEEKEFHEENSDEEINQESHNKLLSAVSRIYKKQRVDKPKRSEPYQNVSEYHLSSYEGREGEQDKIEVYDLVNALEKKSSHKKIMSKFKSLGAKSEKLPKPLEKIYADKVKRSVGYEHLKKHVSRWNEIVKDNQTASQLSFPLKDESEVKVYQPLTFLSTFKEPTELERNMAEVLQQSAVAQKDAEVEEAIFNLSIPEMIKKRKFIAKMKAKESFKIVKAMKQNKIKSKKYRRILRKEKVKQELKDFETLQRTDPEAALEKLNKLEKERAEERASLRHRNTGKWARGQAIRAKYDVEARIQLAEQIAKSRELTQKQKLAEESSSEEEEDEEEEENDNNEMEPKNLMIWRKGDDDNPWTNEQQEKEQTVDEFIAGYQNYWKSKKNQTVSKPFVNKAALARLTGKSTVKGDNHDKLAISIKSSASELKNDPSVTDDAGSISPSTEPLLDSVNKSPKKIGTFQSRATDSTTENISEISHKIIHPDVSLNISKNQLKSNSKEKNSSKSLIAEEDKAKLVYKQELSGETKKRKLSKSSAVNKKKQRINTISGSWDIEVTSEKSGSLVKNKDKFNRKTTQSIDDMFDKMEDTLEDKICERLKKLEDTSSDEEDERKFKKKRNKKFPNKKEEIKLSEERIIKETSSRTSDDKDEEMEDLLKIIEDGDESKSKDNINKKDPSIDPNKFLNVKPRVLSSQIPDMMVDGEDMIDDPEDDRRMKISEAFADDDVVDQFRKEKEEEIKESENKDIDLFLPGWGSWGGPNTDSKALKRKRKRFIIKAPKEKRKDSSKPNVIISQDISNKYKEHMVSDVPFPFASVRNYEASIRAPVGSTWVPESAVKKLTLPPVIKKLGTIIQPMSEAYLTKNNERKSKLKVNNFRPGDGAKIK